MKTLALVIILSVPSFTFGQLSLKSLIVTNPDSNVLFVEAANYLIIEGTVPKDGIRLTSNKALISKIGSKEFIVDVYKTGEIPLKVYSYNKQRRKLLLSTTFHSEILSIPEAHLGNTKDSILSIKEILDSPQLNVVFPGSCYLNTFIVLRFSLTIGKADGKLLYTETTSGNTLSEMQTNTIKELAPGDHLTFSEINTSCSGCRLIKLNPYRVIVKS